MRRFLIASLLLALPIVASSAAPTTVPATAPAPAPTSAPAAELTVRDAVILGLVEGVTEYLPVSSTGHLIVANYFLRIDSENPLFDRDGRPLWYKKPSKKNPDGVPLTTKLAANTFTIVIQFGAIAAVGLLYWRQFLAMINGLLGRDPAGLRLLRNILIAFVPSAVLGLLIHNWIDEHLFSIGAVITAQVVGAVVMLLAEAYRRGRKAQTQNPSDMTVGSATGIGLLQCAALWPGMSRSMTTIVGGYLAGLDGRRAAEFSFLLGFVTLTAATVFKSYQSGAAMIAVFGWAHVLLGCAVAAVSAAVAVRFLVNWVSRHGLAAFAYYRLAFAAVLAALTWL
jgi:undecaprenyl-diphosphatase